MLHMPFPSLLSLDVVFENPTLFLNSLESFLKSPPKIRKLCIRMCPREAAIGDIDANYITRWQNLQSVFCPQVALDMNLLVHLSRMPILGRLAAVHGTQQSSWTTAQYRVERRPDGQRTT